MNPKSEGGEREADGKPHSARPSRSLEIAQNGSGSCSAEVGFISHQAATSTRWGGHPFKTHHLGTTAEDLGCP